jgi:hypothetical protein
VKKRIDRLHPTLRALQIDNARIDAERKANPKKRPKGDPIGVARKLGRKHRNKGNPIEFNPYDKPELQAAHRLGWLERDAEITLGVKRHE